MQNALVNVVNAPTSSTVDLEVVSPVPTVVQTPATLEVLSPATAVVESPVVMETAAPATTEEESPATAEASSTKKAKINRVAVKVKRNKDSFRPMKAIAAKVATKENLVTKTLKFIVPSKDGITSNDEFIGVRDLAVDLAQAGGVPLKLVGFTNGSWEVILDLKHLASVAVDDDQLLSDTFKSLNETITSSAILTNGYVSQARPRWEFAIKKDFVADHDTF